MKFEKIRVERAPGLETPFELSGLAPGFNLVLGPNGSGKSRLCELIREVLWPTAGGNAVVGSLRIQAGEQRFTVLRDADHSEWTADAGELAPPVLPESHHSSCFILRAGDLLSAQARTDMEIAREIRKQMAGGYDLDQVQAEHFTTSKKHGAAQARSLREARKELDQVQSEFRSLVDQEERLAELGPRIESAERAYRELRVLETVRDLAAEREELAELSTKLESFPSGMDRLLGGEHERLVELEEELAARNEELADIEARRELRLERLRVCSPVSDTSRGETSLEEIAEWKRRAGALLRLEEQCAGLQQEATTADVALRNARANLAGEFSVSSEEQPAVELLEALEQHLVRASGLREELQRKQGRLATLAPASDEEEFSEQEVQDLEDAVDALREWLGHPLLEVVLARLPLLWVGALVCTALGVWLADRFTAEWYVLSGVGVALGGFAWAVGNTARAEQLARREAQRDFEGTRQDEPERWRSHDVLIRLRELEVLLHEARTARSIALDRDFLQRGLGEDQARLRVLEQERTQLAERAGVDAGCGELTLLELARRLDAVRGAASASREADARSDEAQNRRVAAHDTLSDWLSERGLAPRESDAISLGECVEQFEQQVRESRRLQREIEEHDASSRRASEKLAELRGRIEKLYKEVALEVGASAELERRISLLAEYRSITEGRRVRLAQIARLTEALPGGQPELSRTDAETAIASVEQEASELGELQEKRATLQAELDTARGGTRMADAIEGVETARVDLEDQREVALDARMGQLLIRELGEEYRRSSIPDVLEHSMSLFGRFTQHAYELRLDEFDGESRFRARDVQHDRILELSQLSDGTRTQLLLASRFAFALDLGAEPIPFLLDETLSLADPERFGEIARSIFALVEEGRQVVYLTSRPAELASFERAAKELGLEAPHVLDLSEARGLATRVERAEELDYELTPQLPSPASFTAEEYGVQLRVPLPDPDQPVGALHLFHLLRDDPESLELLRELLQGQCLTLGQWQTMVENGAASVLCASPENRSWLSARCEVAVEVHESWSLGRGRRFGRPELRSSGAVTDRFLDNLAALAEEVDGDAERFLESLRGKHELAKGFKTKKREELEGWLAEQGFLDRRTALTREQVGQRVLARCGSAITEGVLTTGEVVTLTSVLWAALENGLAKTRGEDVASEGARDSAPSARESEKSAEPGH